MQIQTISKSDWITTLSDGHKLVLDGFVAQTYL